MAANKLTVDPAALEYGVKRIRTLMSEYEKHYNTMRACLTAVNLDSKQRQALDTASAQLATQYEAMKNYLENGVIEMFETAAKTYRKADIK